MATTISNESITHANGGHDNDAIEKEKKLASTAVPMFSIWRHHNGSSYVVEDYVVIEATERIGICYKNLDLTAPQTRWCRPINEWNDLMNHDGRDVKRFKRTGQTNRVKLWITRNNGLAYALLMVFWIILSVPTNLIFSNHPNRVVISSVVLIFGLLIALLI